MRYRIYVVYDVDAEYEAEAADLVMSEETVHIRKFLRAEPVDEEQE